MLLAVVGIQYPSVMELVYKILVRAVYRSRTSLLGPIHVGGVSTIVSPQYQSRGISRAVGRISEGKFLSLSDARTGAISKERGYFGLCELKFSLDNLALARTRDVVGAS